MTQRLQQAQAILSDLLPHDCPECGGKGEYPNPEMEAWRERYPGAFDLCLSDPVQGAEWDRLVKADPLPSDFLRCGECINGKVGLNPNTPQGKLAQIISLLLDELEGK